MIKSLVLVQNELKAPKNLRNEFGKYNYRNAESILEAVKPLLAKYDLMLYFDEEIEEVCGRVFIVSMAHITDGAEEIVAVGRAEMDAVKKGMDLAQLTGSCSSYAKKYALGNLFLIDDSRDSDATNDGSNNTYEEMVANALANIALIESVKELYNYYGKLPKAVKEDKRVIDFCANKKESL